MRHSGRNPLFLCAVAGALLLAASCGTKGPEPPKPGSPAFIWAVARDSYKAGDYVKTNESLEQLVRGKSEFAARAMPMKLIVGIGVAKGYMDLADKYETGAKASRTNPGAFRKLMSAYRTQARIISVQIAETVHQYLNPSKEPNLTLAFPFPSGGIEESPALKKVITGMPLPEAEVDKVAREMLQRGVVQMACRVVKAPKDLEKARAAFQPEDTQVPREQFVLAIANALYEVSDLFGSKKLDEPDKVKTLCEQAIEGLETLPQSKERKDLTEKIQKALKKIRPTRG